MSSILTINRRTFLRGAGALVALPFLESLTGRQAAASSYPARICFLYVPNGMHMADWTPPEIGPLDSKRLPAILRPLDDPALAEYLLVAGGLHNRASERAGAQPLGQHARSIAACLSAVYPESAPRAGATIDVLLSRGLPGRSRVPLLNLATEYAEDQRDPGYGEFFNYALSWKDSNTPIQPTLKPQDVFKQLCPRSPRETEATASEQQRERNSVLDAVRESSTSVRNKLSTEDRNAFDDYLQHLREIEQELETATFADTPEACADGSAWNEEPKSFEDRLRIMLDLLHLAMRANLTRVSTLMFGAERSDRDFGFLSERAGFNMSGGHHRISHHQGDPHQVRKYVQISAFHTGHLARFLRKLKDTREGSGNLLDNTLVVYGASMSDGNAHDHSNVPLLLAGKGAGLMNPGKKGAYVHYGDKPLANLYLTLLQKLSVLDSTGNVYTSFGNSGGTLSLPGGY